MNEVAKNILVNDKIFIIRGVQVMIDRDLAELYQVETRTLNQAVKRNIDSFPCDFLFELTEIEKNELITKCDNLQSLKFNPSKVKVFTEQGVYMLATVLKSKIAREVNIQIMRTFTKMREFALNYADITKKLSNLEKTILTDQQQINYNTERIDDALALLTEILNDTKQTSKNLIGFRPNGK